MRRRLVVALVVASLTALTACTYFPTINDVGSVRIEPRNGRTVRLADNGAEFYVDLGSVGKYGDVLRSARMPLATRAVILSPAGTPVDQVTIPGAAVVRLQPGGYRVALSDFTRPLRAGEVVIVTLVFEKTGGLGVITVVE